ncbi:RagB/SusD family nutrient uptake outer membrane protein [Carboxylicivirga mesophila]|uniref:RagB/SusD family nutrient uptake outer membrane protein n=1 Tax=Carboxylicivirga mesophila TaxID=1166478 RepID=A0ABS5KAG1_9BACT|nr:RagB/SusD family nutrient uptake outer membrane protein [Carboxylicivirga mesophila]MBS2211954.1 RagB/SusD family nutrient uptake outer membrane protein [Carboxylicivirga mesophila]
MNKILYISIIAASLILMTGCGDEFLNRENLYEKNLETYYETPKDVDEALIGAYSRLTVDAGINHPMLLANVLSDDCYSGGGTGDAEAWDIDQQKNRAEDRYLHIYQRSYSGIYSLNMLLNNFDKAVYEDAVLQKQHKGEAQFLRAYYYFRLAQLFGEVPLNLGTELAYLGKASHEELYQQIASDLKGAIENLPDEAWTEGWANENSGRATKWAAEALMARVYLFYTGYYNASDLPGGITKANVVEWIEDCINNSGHGLLDDFRSNWPYAHLFVDEDDNGVDDIPWPGDGHKETVWAIKYTNQGHWAGPGNPGRLAYTNQQVLYNSMRGGVDYPPYGQGWGIGQVSTLLDAAMLGDPRQEMTIIDVTTDPALVGSHEWGAWQFRDETGLYNKKYSAILTATTNDAGQTVYKGMYYNLFGGLEESYQLWNMQDDIIIRFADVLLMHSELTGTADGLTEVRARVGLDEVAYSLDNIKKERRIELALEGVRYYDLLRWGDAKTAIEAANGAPVKLLGLDDVYSVNFDEAKAFLPLPESEINLSRGNLIQNPGWAK